jgi:cytochrome c oxidase subunit II
MLTRLLGLTEDASAEGFVINHLLEVVHWFIFALFIGWVLFFGYMLWRFSQKNNPKAQYTGFNSNASTHAEIGVIVVEVLLLLGFAIPIWTHRINDFPVVGATEVHAIAYQFGWNFHYPGEDGKFGRVSPTLITGSNAVGIDWTDPAAKDDVVVLNNMKVPLNQKIAVRVTSKDVIHNFAAPSFRVAKDAIPGLYNPIWFTPIKEGNYDIICGQLCGAGHGIMKGGIEVIPQQDFDAFIKNGKSAPAEEKVAALN